MKIFRLIFAQISQQKLAHSMSVLLVSIGIVFALFALAAPNYIKDITLSKIKGIDIIVGAKGSPLQLVLANAFHLDQPTGNINFSQTEQLTKNPQIKTAIPLAYGDYYKQYRILGTDTSFLHFYQLELTKGKWNTELNEVIISEQVAHKEGLNIHDTFLGAHGDMQGNPHDESYVVVGIFKTNQTVADQLILTSLASVWHTHHSAKKEITALLITCKTPLAKLTLPNFINKNTPFLAALPTIEVNRLLGFMENGFTVISLLAWLLIGFAGLSLLFNMMNSMQQRKFDLGLFRIMGASPLQCSLIVVLEAFIIVAVGVVFGIVLVAMLPMLINPYLPSGMQLELTPLLADALLQLLPSLFAITLFASLIPAIKAYNTPLTTLLNHA